MATLLISAIAKFVNRGDLRSAVTITIPGGIVTGTLITQAEYLRRLSEAVKAGQGDVAKELGEAFAAAAEKTEAFAAEADEEVQEHEPEVLYFAEAVLFLGVHEAPVGLWTCRVADVSGFTMGKISVSRP
jgi:hypothetical protein